MSHETYVIKSAASPALPKPLAFIMSSLVMMAMAFLSALSLPVKAETQPLNMVVFGDSLVAGYGLGPGEAFPEKLQNALKEKGIAVKVENAGVSGDTTTGGLSRLDWSIPDGTDLVLIELGANDALRGIEPAVTRKNLETMITRLKERDIDVMLAGMLAPPNMGKDYEEAFNPIYPELAEAYDVPLYPFFLDGVAAERELNQADGIHPTAEGIDVIVERFLPFFEANLSAS